MFLQTETPDNNDLCRILITCELISMKTFPATDKKPMSKKKKLIVHTVHGKYLKELN